MEIEVKTLPFEYWNALASQMIVIASLMAGFSLSLIFLLEKNSKSKFSKLIFKGTVLSTSAFLISLFASTKIILLTTAGVPAQVTDASLNFPRFVGGFSFFIGIISTLLVISLSGWNKQENAKWFTLIVGIITFLLICSMITL